VTEAALALPVASTDVVPIERFSKVIADIGTSAAPVPKRARSTKRATVERPPVDSKIQRDG